MLSGAAFPLCYAVAAGPLSTFVEDGRIKMLLYAPVGRPRLLASHLFPPLIARLLVGDDTASLLYIIGSDVLLYTLLTYFTLLSFSFTRVAINEGPPPSPPDVL
jgi:hypothetical protein